MLYCQLPPPLPWSSYCFPLKEEKEKKHMANDVACWGSTCLALCADSRREEAGVRKQRRGGGDEEE